jgi:hypothetical protein
MPKGLFEETLLPVSIDAMVKEVQREIRQRERVYPRFVGAGKMTQVAADRQIEVMQAIGGILVAVRDGKMKL